MPDRLIVYDTAMEKSEADEADTIAGLDAALSQIRETTFKDSGYASRSVHAKSHGLLRGTLRVKDDLPPELAQGIFAASGTYPVIIRLSTIPGDILDDSVSTPRGFAMKVVGVQGSRLSGSEDDETQDFVLVNAPAFSAPTAQKFLGNLKLLAGTTDKVEGLKKFVSSVARGTEAVLEAVGTKSPTVITMGGQPATHLLGDTYYSQTPFLYGSHICKFALAPASPSLLALKDKRIDIDDNSNALRNAVIDLFAANEAEWVLQVQLNTDLQAMPIEDASVAWPEDQSPYVTVATVTASPQDAWSAENQRAIDDGLFFSPWHGIAAHRPLGGVNRARKATYANSASFRGAHNGCPMREPKRRE